MSRDNFIYFLSASFGFTVFLAAFVARFGFGVGSGSDFGSAGFSASFASLNACTSAGIVTVSSSIFTKVADNCSSAWTLSHCFAENLLSTPVNLFFARTKLAIFA